jgi:thiol-disulfide isomerase/thioredoxin
MTRRVCQIQSSSNREQAMKFISSIIANVLVYAVPLTAFTQDWGGQWDMQIECPGGGIRFGLDLQEKSGQWSGFLINGPERIKIPMVDVDHQTLKLKIDHYDSELELRFDDSSRGAKANGTWKKRRNAEQWVMMNCSAERPRETDDYEPSERFLGRWAVQFESSDDPAVGVFKKFKGHRVSGTFLTSTGDYRFLDGGVKDGKLQLSCFDGAHAFLFQAEVSGEQALKGDFWSSNTWHETWTAKRDQNASLPDEFKQTILSNNVDLGALSFPDLDGKPTRLDDPKFAGKARIIYVFGSWCPNCHDAGAYFAELEKKYGAKGLSILGLAFELTGDFERDADQVKKYLKRHGSRYPVLVAGLADKSEASKSFPALDRVRSYPTTIFLDRNGDVAAVHTGFSGPATGEAYQQLKQKFEERIENLIKD